jgi:hypothetical protein
MLLALVRRDVSGARLCYASPMAGVFTIRTTVLGCVSWLIPFVASFLFFDRTGQLLIPQPLFKSMMVVVVGGIGVALLVSAFRRVPPSLHSGLALGCYWLAINVALDLAVLVPLVRMPVVLYLYDIGLRYLLLPVVGTAMGVVGARRASPDTRR